MNRRKFVIGAGVSAVTAAGSRFLVAEPGTSAPARLTVQARSTGPSIPRDFLGLSYESAQLASPDFFSPQNTDYAGFLTSLGSNGVLRLGGNTSGYSIWTPDAQKAIDSHNTPPLPVGPDDASKPLALTQTTPQSIRNLRDFLDMIQWRCIYGLNFAKGTPEQAADEASAVSAILGERLVCFQFGNEVDNFGKKGLRPAGYDYPTFAREWERFYQAVSARVPNLKVAGPDSALFGAWMQPFAEQYGNKLVLLTTHFYAEGPSASPDATIARLMNTCNQRWYDGLPEVLEATAQSHLPFRLTETNSCFHGGKAGVSNTFASSLWALDLMFQLIAAGGCGINFHGGGYGIYAPIVGSPEKGFGARPEYYALLLISQLVGGQMVASALDAPKPTPGTSPALVAYSARNSAGKLVSIIINKNRRLSFDLAIDGGEAAERITVQRLIAPDLEAQGNVTFGGAPVGVAGHWRAARVEHLSLKGGRASCYVPAASAALLTWEN